MGWMQALYETYDKAEGFIGKADDTGSTLLPIAHSTQNAQIEISIDMDGCFVNARTVQKGEEVTIIPVTEDSGSRANGIAPHPLCDKLCYIAGDYRTYCDEKFEAYYKAYMEQLEAWHSRGCHPYVEAVYRYAKKGTIIGDLIEADIFTLDENEKLDSSVKVEKIPQPDAFIRFRIETDPKLGLGLGEIWKEDQVHRDYIEYYLTRIEKEDLDYITGQYMPCSDKQPSKIRYSGDKAKLVSANDSSGFTYRGRFTERDQAVSLGYIPSQKAHNALKWLIERQGYQKGGRVIVVWNPANYAVPDWLAGTNDYYEDMDETPDFALPYAGRVKTAIGASYCDIDTQDTDIIVMALDAATPGRLSITYYRQIQGAQFLERMVDWHTSCVWAMSYVPVIKGRPVVMAPKPEDIVKAAFGHEQNGILTVNESLSKNTLERLLPCIVDGRKIPEDIVLAAFHNATRPLAFNSYNRRKITDITCALLNRKYYRNKKEENAMALNRQWDDRDYLYGRLLAVAYKLEYDTFTKDEQGKRETNAARYTSQMVQNPKRTWQVIEDRLLPYKKKLGSKAGYYQKEFQQIYDLFTPENLGERRRLNEQYLLGYNCELSYLFADHKKTDEDTATD